MNIRKVVTYNNLRKQFTSEELILADTLYNASESEREMLVESLGPVKSVAKKAAKKSSSKSQRASGMAAAIKKSLESQLRVTGNGKCAFVFDSGETCNAKEDDPIHDPSFGYAGYHPFQPATPAPSAAQPSSASSGGGSTTPSFVDETVSVGGVAGGSNES